MCKIFRIAAVTVFSILTLTALSYAGNETISITTYYPSPYGSYNDLYVANKLGVGTASPGTKLHVSAGAATNPVIIETSSGESDINFLDGTRNFQVGVNLYGFYVYDTAYRLVVNPTTGNVGIGTPSPPGEKLEVNGNIKLSTAVGAYGAGRIQAISTADLVGFTLNSGSRAWDIASITSTSPDYFAIRDYTAGAVRLAIDEIGNVGIGTTGQETKLHITDTTAVTSFTGDNNQGIRIDGSPTTNHYSLLGFSGYPGYPRNLAQIGAKYTGSGTYLFFGTSNSYATGITNEAMVIDYSGNVGIGDTTPDAKLDVEGDIRLGTGATTVRFFVVSGVCPAGAATIAAHVVEKTCNGQEKVCMHYWDSDCSYHPETCTGATSCTIPAGWNSATSCTYLNEGCVHDGWICYTFDSESCAWTPAGATCYADPPDMSVCVAD